MWVGEFVGLQLSTNNREIGKKKKAGFWTGRTEGHIKWESLKKKREEGQNQEIRQRRAVRGKEKRTSLNKTKTPRPREGNA